MRTVQPVARLVPVGNVATGAVRERRTAFGIDASAARYARFDRILVAQALHEHLTIVTIDARG